jgi:hypothetical protein
MVQRKFRVGVLQSLELCIGQIVADHHFLFLCAGLGSFCQALRRFRIEEVLGGGTQSSHSARGQRIYRILFEDVGLN